MTEQDRPQAFNPEDYDTTEPLDPPLSPADETLTTEIVRVDVGASVPYSLPHVSELDEATPHDARSNPNRLVTLPAYSQIVPPPESRSTARQKPIRPPMALLLPISTRANHPSAFRLVFPNLPLPPPRHQVSKVPAPLPMLSNSRENAGADAAF